MFAYIMAPERRAGAGWGPNLGAPGAASRQALHLLRPRHRQRAGESVGTVVHLNGDSLDQAHGLVAVAAAKFQVEGGNFQKVEIFKLDVTSSLNLSTAAHHWHMYSHITQVGHLVVAGLPHCGVTDSHTGRPRSLPSRLGFTVSLAQPDSRCD
jgi:hypothetical protein